MKLKCRKYCSLLIGGHPIFMTNGSNMNYMIKEYLSNFVIISIRKK